MASWPEKRQLIGTDVPRIDGLKKVTGAARYSYDVNLPGLLHAKILRSPYPKAKIISIDTSAAEALPGVRAIHAIKKAGDQVNYAGDEVLALAATSLRLADDALRAIKVAYEVLPHLASEEQARQAGGDAARTGNRDVRGDDVAQVLERAAAVQEGTYGCDVVTHVCLETHGLTAKWDGDKLTVWASTQAVHATKDALVNHFGTPNVTCVADYMGGGFGSKFGPDIQGVAAAELAKKANAPVKLMLDRAEEHVAGGNRPSGFARVKGGVDKDGKLIAFDAETWGTGGHSRGAGFPLPYIYAVENRRRQHTDLFVNAGDARAMRAPGHPQGCLIMECFMDDLCHKLDPALDPIEFRIRNLPTDSEIRPIWIKELRLGAARIGWREKWHPRGDTSPGPWKRGVGCAIGTWAGRAGGAQATCTIHPNGRVDSECGTQDLGTGTTTLVPLVTAEILGLQVEDISGRIGSSQYPPAGGSGGSTSCGGVSLATAVAAQRALAALFERVAPKLGVAAGDLEAEGGRVYVKGDPERGFTWKQACAHLGQEPIVQSASRDDGRGMSSSGVGGAQFADVSVDVETGRVRINKFVAIADCGMVMNRLLCESQVLGGVIMGINYGLFEYRRLDPVHGLQVNADMEFYLLAGAGDIPEIDCVLLDYPERGVIGIGEPPTIPTAAAISNAVANAIGVRVPTIPITPRRVLEALERRV